MAQGSIRPYTSRDGRTTWRVRVDLGPDPVTGARRQRLRTCATEPTAQRVLRGWLSEIDRGTATDHARWTLAELCAYWLSTYIVPSCKGSTIDTYETTIRCHLSPGLGSLRAGALTPLRVQEFYAAKVAAGASDHLVRRCHTNLVQILDVGVALGLLPANVARLAQLPPRRRGAHPEGDDTAGRMHTWTAEEARAFLAHPYDGRFGPLWHLILRTGLRRGEALGLRWRDVDLEARRLWVRQSCEPCRRGGGPMVLDIPKTDSSRRLLPLPAALVEPVRAQRAVQNAQRLAAGATWQDFGLIFARADGRPYDPSNVRHDFYRSARAAGVPRIRVHDLRHTWVTLALRAGIPIHVVSKRAGHAKVSITLDIYAHVLKEQQERADATMADVFG